MWDWPRFHAESGTGVGGDGGDQGRGGLVVDWLDDVGDLGEVDVLLDDFNDGQCDLGEGQGLVAGDGRCGSQ